MLLVAQNSYSNLRGKGIWNSLNCQWKLGVASKSEEAYKTTPQLPGLLTQMTAIDLVTQYNIVPTKMKVAVRWFSWLHCNIIIDLWYQCSLQTTWLHSLTAKLYINIFVSKTVYINNYMYICLLSFASLQIAWLHWLTAILCRNTFVSKTGYIFRAVSS